MEDLERMQNEINEMEKVFEESGVEGQETETEDEVTETETEAKNEETGAQEEETETGTKEETQETQETGTQETETKEEPTESEGESTEPTEEDDKDKTIKELMDKLTSIEEKLKTKETQPAEEGTQEEKETETQEPSITEEDFVGDLDLDDLTNDPTALNNLLNTIYKKAIEFAKTEARSSAENVVRSIPDIVKSNVTMTARLKKIHDDFYNENKDLVMWKTAVGTVFEEMISKSPDKTYEELLPQVADEVRRRLSLQKQAEGKNQPPKLPRKKGGPRQTAKPDIDPFVKEIEEMDKALGND